MGVVHFRVEKGGVTPIGVGTSDDGLRFRETEFRGSETTRPKSTSGPSWSLRRPNQGRQSPPIGRLSAAVGKSPLSSDCVVADAVAWQPVSIVKFPIITEFNREFADFRWDLAPGYSENGLISNGYRRIPCAAKSGIQFA